MGILYVTYVQCFIFCPDNNYSQDFNNKEGISLTGFRLKFFALFALF